MKYEVCASSFDAGTSAMRMRSDPSLPFIAPILVRIDSEGLKSNRSGACIGARTFDKLTALDNMGVRVVDGNVETKSL